MIPSLIMLRGLPGAGKSTLAKLLAEDGRWPVYSVDEFFVDPQGNYQFDYTQNHLAYKQCLANTESAMKSGIQKIFIDHTLTIDWELEQYFKLAQSLQYRVFVMTVENRHHGQNHHGIPESQLQKMAEKYKVVLLS